MSFHKSSFGKFGINLPCDANGFVPEDGDIEKEFAQPSTGWPGGSFKAFKTLAVEMTAKADARLYDWRTDNLNLYPNKF